MVGIMMSTDYVNGFRRLLLIFSVGFALFLSGFYPQDVLSAERPNVIVIISDDQG